MNHQEISGLRIALLGAIVVLFFVFFPSLSHAQGAASGGSTQFSVGAPQFNGDRLQFDYYAPYPGMTKVFLFDRKGKLIWRGQYIDPEGNNKLLLRSSYLEPGNSYVFQFEYKLEMVRVPVVAP